MKQALLKDIENTVIVQAEMPTIKDNEVLIKVKRVGICGSDIHIYHGCHPFVKPPVIQGHEFSGTIEETGKNINDLFVGEKVTVMPQEFCSKCYYCKTGNYHICENLRVIGAKAPGAAQEYFCIDRSMVIKLPVEMSFDQGAMVEPTAVGVHAINIAGNLTGKNVIVLGAGPIGNLTAQCAAAIGAKNVIITDISESKLEIAKECGIKHTVNVKTKELAEEIKRLFGESRADIIIECVGCGSTINQAIEVSRKGSVIVIVGVSGDMPCINMALIQKHELILKGSMMYKRDSFEKACQLIAQKTVNCDKLISRYFSIDEYNKAYKYIEEHSETCMKVLIKVN